MKLSLMLQVADVPANKFVRVKSPLIEESYTLRNDFARKFTNTSKYDTWPNRTSIIDLELSIKFVAMYIKADNPQKYAALLTAFYPYGIVGDMEYFLGELTELPVNLIEKIVAANPRRALRNLLLVTTLSAMRTLSNQKLLLQELQNVS